MPKYGKAKMKEEKFHCSIGYAYKDANQTIEELSKIAEERMYKDKSEFYKNSHIERRKADQI